MTRRRSESSGPQAAQAEFSQRLLARKAAARNVTSKGQWGPTVAFQQTSTNGSTSASSPTEDGESQGLSPPVSNRAETRGVLVTDMATDAATGAAVDPSDEEGDVLVWRLEQFHA